MDLLRIVCLGGEVVYVDARAKFLLSAMGNDTLVYVGDGGKEMCKLPVAGDVDEFAAVLESAFHGCHIHRVG